MKPNVRRTFKTGHGSALHLPGPAIREDRPFAGLREIMALAARLVSDLRMASDNSALVLLHGILMSGNAWQDVVPLLSNHHQVYTPTAAGHG